MVAVATSDSAVATLVPVVQSLKKNGLIEHRRDPHDRRRSPFYLTHRGEVMLKKIFVLNEKDIAMRGMKRLGTKDMNELRRILRKLVSVIAGKEKVRQVAASCELKNK